MNKEFRFYFKLPMMSRHHKAYRGNHPLSLELANFKLPQEFLGLRDNLLLDKETLYLVQEQ